MSETTKAKKEREKREKKEKKERAKAEKKAKKAKDGGEAGATDYESDGGDTDIGDSPCPPPTKNVVFKGKKIGRAPLVRAETYGPSRMAMGH